MVLPTERSSIGNVHGYLSAPEIWPPSCLFTVHESNRIVSRGFIAPEFEPPRTPMLGFVNADCS